MNNNLESWGWDKEKALYETRLQPLRSHFQSTVKSIPPTQRLHLCGMFIDDLWDIVYRENLETSSPILKGGLPNISTALLSQRSSPRTPKIYAKSPTEAEERLALLVHHNCVLKPERQSAFQQALSTIMMRSSLVGNVVGDIDGWEYLVNKEVERADYAGRKIPIWTKEYWQLVQHNTINKFKSSVYRIKRFIQQKRYLVKNWNIRLWKNTKLDTEHNAHLYDYLDSQEFKNSSFAIKRRKKAAEEFKLREKLAIEFLKNARGQV